MPMASFFFYFLMLYLQLVLSDCENNDVSYQEVLTFSPGTEDHNH